MTSTCAGYMKPFYTGMSDVSDEEDDTSTVNDGGDQHGSSDSELEFSNCASGFPGFEDDDIIRAG